MSLPTLNLSQHSSNTSIADFGYNCFVYYPHIHLYCNFNFFHLENILISYPWTFWFSHKFQNQMWFCIKTSWYFNCYFYLCPILEYPQIFWSLNGTISGFLVLDEFIICCFMGTGERVVRCTFIYSSSMSYIKFLKFTFQVFERIQHCL